MTLEQQQALAIADAELAAREKRAAAARPARLGAEGGLMAGMVPGAKQAGGAVLDIAMEGGLSAAGQVIGATAGPFAPVAVPALGSAGASAGNAMAQLRQMAAGERPNFSVAENVAAAALGAIPGEALAGAGLRKVANIAGKNVAGGLISKTAETGLGPEKRMPTLSEAAFQTGASIAGVGAAKAIDTGAQLSKAAKRMIQNSVEDQTISLLHNAGYKLDPSKINPGAVVSALEYLGGKAPTAAEFAKHNANVTLGLAKKALGLPVTDVLDIAAIDGVKKKAGLAYEAVNNVSPKAKNALEKYKEANELAHAYALDAKSPMPNGNRYQSKLDAKEWKDKADAYWKTIIDEADSAGKPGLVNELKSAEKTIAKANVVLEAFNEGSGKPSAALISKARENRGALLDDELQIIHRFAQAFPQETGGDISQKQGGVIFNRLTTLAAVGATAHYGGMATAAGLAGVALGAPVLARSALSDPVINKYLTTRNYTPRMAEDFKALAAQKAVSSFSPREFEALWNGIRKQKGKESKP